MLQKFSDECDQGLSKDLLTKDFGNSEVRASHPTYDHCNDKGDYSEHNCNPPPDL